MDGRWIRPIRTYHHYKEDHMSSLNRTVGLIVLLVMGPRKPDERGLSQSTENAILLAGAAAIAVVIVTAITLYVTDRLPR
ncbi:hypothetical protein GCM10022275_14020 [Tessaracoccus defluvii]